MTPRAQWLLAACAVAAVGLAFIWAVSRLERRWDDLGVRQLPPAHDRRTHDRPDDSRTLDPAKRPVAGRDRLP